MAISLNGISFIVIKIIMKETISLDKKLSIIMPAYNSAQYIKDCIDSCERQDILTDDYEIIVINDGSTDNTLQIVSECQQYYSNIIVVNQPNQGQSVARNTGVKIAKGEYIWFVDSDDQISSDCLGAILRIVRELNLDALCIMFKTGASFCEKLPSTMKQMPLLNMKIDDGECFLLDNKPIIQAPWGYIFKKSFWCDNRFEFIPGIYFEDTQLISIVLSKCKRVATLSESISCYNYIYRMNSTVNSVPNEKKIRGYAVISDTHMKYSMSLNSLKLKRYFAVSSSYAFIEGIKMIYFRNENINMDINKFCMAISCRPTTIFATSFIRKIEQYLILHFPYGYCFFRKIFRL